MIVPLDEIGPALEDFLTDVLSSDGRRQIFVATAAEGIAEFREEWRAATGTARIETAVDGRKGAPFESVKIPGGVIAARVNALLPIVSRAFELLDQFTKVVTGGFKSKTYLFVNDVRAANVAETDLGTLVTIANVSAFARKAERRGFSKVDGAPFSDGLFEGIAAILGREFQETLTGVYFTFRDYGAGRVPTIAIGEGADQQGRRPPGYSDAGGARNDFAARYRRKKGR